MRKGQCPKCGSSNVFTKKDGINYGAFEIVISFLVAHSPANDYICTDCGYFERYIDDQPKLVEVAQKWQKVR
ncbi:MAG: hypothetical protein IPP66_18210 [Anaerolineales bacterium]|nr:hypothetical protein [Anaerolineales bacterium]